jgi:hypothetical protein
MRSSTTDVTRRLVAGGHLTETPVDSVYSVLYPYAFGSLRSSPNSTAVTPGAQIFLCLPRVIHPRKCTLLLVPNSELEGHLSSLSRRYMAYDPPDYDGHKDSLTYYAIWDSSYLKRQGHLDARLRRPLRVHSCVDDLIASRKPQEIITALETTHKFRLRIRTNHFSFRL